MLVCLDIGNSQIFGGAWREQKLVTTFRRASQVRASSDELGTFLRAVLRENGVPPEQIRAASVCSVVPDAVHSVRNCFQRYFGFQPFVLQAGVRTGLKIRYQNPLEVGADKIANAIAAVVRFPARNILIVDFGTATTVCAISRDKEYLGGIITPGIHVSMAALESNTARLPAVEIVRPEEVLGRSTVSSIQSGLYFGTLASVRALTAAIARDHFEGDPPVVVGTGPFGRLFEREQLLDHFLPELVLDGLRLAAALN